MGFLGLDDVLDSIVSDTIADSIEMIDIDELHNSADNFFEVNRVEELAESILGQGGVKENLIVRPLESGGYEIISGHRRKAAVQYLIDKGEDVSHFLPCLVQEYSDDSNRVLDLILMNTSQRVLSDAEIMTSFEKLDTILKEKKALGEKFGKTREKIAEVLNVSASQVRKLQNVEKNAIPEVKEAIKSGDISINTADKVASLSLQSQKKVVDSIGDKPITPKDVEKLVTEKVDISDNLGDIDTGVDINDNFCDDSIDYDNTDLDDEKVVISDNFDDIETVADIDENFCDDSAAYDDTDSDDEKVVISDNFYSSKSGEEIDGILFRNAEHAELYEEILDKMGNNDLYHISLAYLLTLDIVTREHITDCFDFDRDVIEIEALNQPWQTVTSEKTTRLAFNLWNGCNDDGEEYTDNDGYKVPLPSSKYSVDKIFCSEYAKYYFEAIKLRFSIK